MSTRVLETIDIITAIFSTPSLLQHLHREALGLRDRGIAADLGVVGGLAALGADRVGQRERAAAGADHEPEVALEAVVLALDHAAVVGGVDRLDVALELRGLVQLTRLVEVDADLVEQLLVAADRLVLHLHVGVERDERPVGELGQRVDLGEGHVVFALEAGELGQHGGRPVELRAGHPDAATTSLARKSEMGWRFERWPRPTWSGCSSATCSMSIPPMSENSIIGRFARPSQSTAA